MGLGGQLIAWSDGIVDGLRARGFFMVRFDGIDRAHVAGVSLGGMITQALTIHHGDLFRSACSIMSTTGDHSVGAPARGDPGVARSHRGPAGVHMPFLVVHGESDPLVTVSGG
jgi:poly(3-hydroxybutyrate) depolymerase